MYIPRHVTDPSVSPKNRTITLLLCLFLGLGGIHRFYVGKFWTGIIWFFTGGFLGIGTLIDFIMILLGSFKDKYEREVKVW
jgi:TM2 domain-containing membrane protein YozV